jgi:hypothetical protein
MGSCSACEVVKSLLRQGKIEGLVCESVSDVSGACEIFTGVNFFRFLLRVEKFLGYGGVNLAMERACSIREVPWFGRGAGEAPMSGLHIVSLLIRRQAHKTSSKYKNN